jgi:hypothetical protein
MLMAKRRTHQIFIAAALALATLVTGCGPLHLRAAYRVTAIEGKRTCIAYVRGDGGSSRACDRFPPAAGARPLRVGDCVLLTWDAGGTRTTRLTLRDDSFCHLRRGL